MIHRLNSFVLILQFILNAFSSSSLISSPASIVMIEFVRREDRLTSSEEKWGDITRYTRVTSKRWRSNTRKRRSHHHQENTWSGSYRLIITSDDDDRKELFATLEEERQVQERERESEVINWEAMSFCFSAFSLSKTSLVYDWNHMNHEKWLSCQVTENREMASWKRKVLLNLLSTTIFFVYWYLFSLSRWSVIRHSFLHLMILLFQVNLRQVIKLFLLVLVPDKEDDQTERDELQIYSLKTRRNSTRNFLLILVEHPKLYY